MFLSSSSSSSPVGRSLAELFDFASDGLGLVGVGLGDGLGALLGQQLDALGLQLDGVLDAEVARKLALLDEGAGPSLVLLPRVVVLLPTVQLALAVIAPSQVLLLATNHHVKSSVCHLFRVARMVVLVRPRVGAETVHADVEKGQLGVGLDAILKALHGQSLPPPTLAPAP